MKRKMLYRIWKIILVYCVICKRVFEQDVEKELFFRKLMIFLYKEFLFRKLMIFLYKRFLFRIWKRILYRNFLFRIWKRAFYRRFLFRIERILYGKFLLRIWKRIFTSGEWDPKHGNREENRYGKQFK